jgi:hypothetical protein
MIHAEYGSGYMRFSQVNGPEATGTPAEPG